jgi:hypothetical protein
MDFTQMDIGTIANGVADNGTRYLQLFLIEYRKLFNETVNPGCLKCLTTYLTKYKNHFKIMSTSKYRLHAKYENIPLEFGSPILVNNSNMTDAYAQKLLKQEDGKRYFSSTPDESEAAPEVTSETLQADVDKAREKVAGLKPNARKDFRQKAEDALRNAEQALTDFNTEQAAANEIEVVLEDDDFTANPELADAGHNVGDTVVVDKKELDQEGTIKVLRKKE